MRPSRSPSGRSEPEGAREPPPPRPSEPPALPGAAPPSGLPAGAPPSRARTRGAAAAVLVPRGRPSALRAAGDGGGGRCSWCDPDLPPPCPPPRKGRVAVPRRATLPGSLKHRLGLAGAASSTRVAGLSVVGVPLRVFAASLFGGWGEDPGAAGGLLLAPSSRLPNPPPRPQCPLQGMGSPWSERAGVGVDRTRGSQAVACAADPPPLLPTRELGILVAAGAEGVPSEGCAAFSFRTGQPLPGACLEAGSAGGYSLGLPFLLRCRQSWNSAAGCLLPEPSAGTVDIVPNPERGRERESWNLLGVSVVGGVRWNHTLEHLSLDVGSPGQCHQLARGRWPLRLEREGSLACCVLAMKYLVSGKDGGERRVMMMGWDQLGSGCWWFLEGLP